MVNRLAGWCGQSLLTPDFRIDYHIGERSPLTFILVVERLAPTTGSLTPTTKSSLLVLLPLRAQIPPSSPECDIQEYMSTSKQELILRLWCLLLTPKGRLTSPQSLTIIFDSRKYRIHMISMPIILRGRRDVVPWQIWSAFQYIFWLVSSGARPSALNWTRYKKPIWGASEQCYSAVDLLGNPLIIF